MSLVTTKTSFGVEGLKFNLNDVKNCLAAKTLLIGIDMTTLGLDVQKARANNLNLFTNFSGPWCDEPIRVYDLEDKVPVQVSESKLLS